MFESSAGVREYFEPVRPKLFAIAGAKSSTRSARRRVAVVAIAFVLVAGNALLLRDLTITRANADHLSHTDRRAGTEIATRQDEVVRAQAALDNATAELARVTRTRDNLEHMNAAVGGEAASRNAQLQTVQARINALHQQIGTFSQCLGFLQGALNAASFNDRPHESQALGRIDPAYGVAR